MVITLLENIAEARPLMPSSNTLAIAPNTVSKADEKISSPITKPPP